MKIATIERLFLAAAALAGAAGLVAAPLSEAAAVHGKPDLASPVLTTLPAGTEPVTATTGYGVLPSGWIAVTLAGPHEVFVQNKDITKSLDVQPGATLHKEPKIESPVVAVAAEGDLTEIVGLRGRWTQLLLNKPLIGYVQISAPVATDTQAVAAAPSPPPPAATPAAAPATSPASAPTTAAAPAPVPAVARGAAEPGQPAPVINLGDSGSSALPRLFQGRFVSTRNPFRPRRPYDYQLTDDSGQRFAYLDISKLLLTEQIEGYLDRTVVVYGAPKPVPGTRDIVIEVESLQLR